MSGREKVEKEADYGRESNRVLRGSADYCPDGTTAKTEAKNTAQGLDSVGREVFLSRSWKRAVLCFYRFARLQPNETRLVSELPLGFRWVFKTDPHLFSALIWELERVQNDSPTALVQTRLERARFCLRWL